MANPIDADEYMSECVQWSLFVGINPHYVAALGLVLAQRPLTGLSEELAGDAFAPFMLKQPDWDARSVDYELDVVLRGPQIVGWQFQVQFAALTGYRAQAGMFERLGRYPNAMELFAEQWPGAVAPSEAAWQNALDATRVGVAKALVDELEQPDLDPATIGAPGSPIGAPTADPTGPIGAHPRDPNDPNVGDDEKKFATLAPGIMSRLMAEFPIQPYQAAAILGNVGYESNGLRVMQEVLRPGSRGPGGLGWAQWSGDRRTKFIAYCNAHGVETSSNAGNLGYLLDELHNSRHNSIDALLIATDLNDAVKKFEAKFEAAGVKRYDRRLRWATLAINQFSQQHDKPPTSVISLLDPSLNFTVLARIPSGAAVFWLFTLSAEHAGQTLIREDSAGAAIVAQGTTVLPLPAGLVPADVSAQLNALFKGSDPRSTLPGGETAVEKIAAAIFARAKQRDGKLITRDVPDTNHGILACAFAVNEIVFEAIGRPVQSDNGRLGLNSDAMARELESNHKTIRESEIIPGAILVALSSGRTHGHVGIVGEALDGGLGNLIYANSSKKGVFEHHYTLSSWHAFFGGTEKLETRFYQMT
jgi:hypothetical protein